MRDPYLIFFTFLWEKKYSRIQEENFSINKKNKNKREMFLCCKIKWFLILTWPIHNLS